MLMLFHYTRNRPTTRSWDAAPGGWLLLIRTEERRVFFSLSKVSLTARALAAIDIRFWHEGDDGKRTPIVGDRRRCRAVDTVLVQCQCHRRGDLTSVVPRRSCDTCAAVCSHRRASRWISRTTILYNNDVRWDRTEWSSGKSVMIVLSSRFPPACTRTRDNWWTKISHGKRKKRAWSIVVQNWMAIANFFFLFTYVVVATQSKHDIFSQSGVDVTRV